MRIITIQRKRAYSLAAALVCWVFLGLCIVLGNIEVIGNRFSQVVSSLFDMANSSAYELEPSLFEVLSIIFEYLISLGIWV